MLAQKICKAISSYKAEIGSIEFFFKELRLTISCDQTVILIGSDLVANECITYTHTDSVWISDIIQNVVKMLTLVKEVKERYEWAYVTAYADRFFSVCNRAYSLGDRLPLWKDLNELSRIFNSLSRKLAKDGIVAPYLMRDGNRIFLYGKNILPAPISEGSYKFYPRTVKHPAGFQFVL